LLKDKVKEVQAFSPAQSASSSGAVADFMTFYGRPRRAGLDVPKKYVEKVGDDGFKARPSAPGPTACLGSSGSGLVSRGLRRLLAERPVGEAAVMRSLPESRRGLRRCGTGRGHRPIS